MNKELIQMRKLLEKLTSSLSDEEIINFPSFVEKWRPNISYEIGKRIEFQGTIYKATQEHVSEAQFTPDLIPALWTIIDIVHSGAIDDPIPAKRNMEYAKGFYYIEDENIYLMNREGMKDGETIMLSYLPSELIGQYFERIS